MTWLCWNNTNKRDELTYGTIVHLAECFVPVVEITKEDLKDYQLMEDTGESGIQTCIDHY